MGSLDLRVGSKFRIGRRIGGGSFGEIYQGTDITTLEPVAIKLELAKTRHPQLLYESRLYKVLHHGKPGGVPGIPMVRWFGVEGDFNVMVVDLLGPSLEDCFNYCGRLFSNKTVLMLADQMIGRVEFLHSRDFLHRDIKPDNFLMGLSRKAHHVYMIDFGLAKKFRDPKTHHHIPYRDGKSLTGTARYASVNTHTGIEQSRRDDLESVGYILMYFLKGQLPWQGLKAYTKKEKYDRIAERKMQTSISELCGGLPHEYANYMHYVRSLRFDDKPDYPTLRSRFRDLLAKEGGKIDYVYDWTIKRIQECAYADEAYRQQQEHRDRKGSQSSIGRRRERHSSRDPGGQDSPRSPRKAREQPAEPTPA
eukprot:TRINITY_DN905_c0_g3_i1.p1 TRINITY_DN905_c0_g3~~TRINITY_DN905_c0_g3_i1.p1  ORF type:complete len:364 (+),score=105.53 TRINITY_DN905_c0_g3_i1:63-1154(+)